MNVIIVSYCHGTDNGGIQIGHLANELALIGVECRVLTPPSSNSTSAEQGFPALPFGSRNLGFANGRGPDLVHAWTPREPVRRQAEMIASRHSCPFIVHLEDNEKLILANEMGRNPVKQALALLLNRANVVPLTLTHPRRGADFMRRAAGITMLTEALKEFVPSSVPTCMFWPGYDPAFNGLPLRDISRRALHIAENEIAIVYTGNIHASNKADMIVLYTQIEVARRGGLPVRLFRTGKGSLPRGKYGANEGVIDLGWKSRDLLPALYAAADLFVQPGKADMFNKYRFPSKIPDMLVSGRPVALPRANIGLHLKDGFDALLLDDRNPDSISEKIAWFSQNRGAAFEIGQRGRAFALERLNWRDAGAALEQFYRDTLIARTPIIAADQ